jgi:hypothetical protein
MKRLPEESMTKSILNVYDQATADERELGLVWYEGAHDIAAGMGISSKAGAGVMAALSPQLAWPANIKAAKNLVANDDPKPAGIGRFVTRGRKIRDGAEPLEELKGRKVRSFYRNIAFPNVSGPVTVDRHAIMIAGGTCLETLNYLGCYQMIAGAYRTAARKLQIKPHELQAITWMRWRSMLNEQGKPGAYQRTAGHVGL